MRRFDFIDPDPGDILDRFARLAAQVFDTEFAALCLVETESVRFVARHGFEVSEITRKGSFFDETIRQDDIVWIADASEVVAFRDTALVAESPGTRFYAGAPLKTPDGFAIGVLCVMDPDPRRLADLANRVALTDLAACAMSEMECWRLNRELESLTARHDEDLRELDLVYDRAPIGLTLIDRDFRFRRINNRLARMNGRSPEEHIGRSVREVVPDVAETVEPLLRCVLETGKPIFDFEVVGESKKEQGGERTWVEDFYPIPDAEGKVGAVAVVVDEVTEQRRAEAVRRDYATRLRRVLDGIGALVALLDVDGTLIEANKSALGLAGLKAEDVLGKRFEDTYWWSYSPDVQAQLSVAMERAREGETVRYDVPVRVGDGRFITVDVQIAPLRDDRGRVINLVPSAVDITERKAAETALAESESLFRETFEQTAVGMAHVGLDGRWIRVNDRLCEIAGHGREALLGKTFHDITHPDDLDTDLEHAARLLNGEVDCYAMEKRYVRADGSITWINLTVSLRRTASGEPDHFISIVEDINKRKKAEERVGVVVRELNHRFKNTLAMIRAVVSHGASEPTPKHEFVRSVIQRIQAMAGAHDLLVRSQWRGAALADLLDDVLRPHGLSRIQTNGPMVWLTPNAALGFCLMMHELGTNAAKYGALSRDEGRVAIDWKVTETAGRRSLSLSWVETGGPPVSPPAHRGFGTKIIEQYVAAEIQGTASMGFDPDGVKVSLWAPAEKVMTDPPADSTSSQQSEAVSAPPSVGTPVRVLVVEDSALIAMDLESILLEAGHTVLGPASTVVEALELVDAATVDVAFLDVDLHGELVTPVADALSGRSIPFAFSTGFEEGGSPLPVFADAPLLGKPFDEQSVLSTLAALIAARSA